MSPESHPGYIGKSNKTPRRTHYTYIHLPGPERFLGPCRMTFIADERFQSFYVESSGVWTLQIKYVQARDAGIYECQVSTEPKISARVHLHVVGEYGHRFCLAAHTHWGGMRNGGGRRERAHFTLVRIAIDSACHWIESLVRMGGLGLSLPALISSVDRELMSRPINIGFKTV